jgi:hypothetical protein
MQHLDPRRLMATRIQAECAHAFAPQAETIRRERERVSGADGDRREPGLGAAPSPASAAPPRER